MMPKTNKYLFAVGLLLIFFSCTNKKEFLTRSWIVNSIELDGIDYGTSIMRLNIFTLNKDNDGETPKIIELNTIDTIRQNNKMQWEYIDSKNKNTYIRIYDSQIDYFNDTFKVNIIDEYNCKVQFESKRVRLNCTGLSCHPLGIGI